MDAGKVGPRASHITDNQLIICLPWELRFPLHWTPTFSPTVEYVPLLGFCFYLLSELSSTSTGTAIVIALTRHPKSPRGRWPLWESLLRECLDVGDMVVALFDVYLESEGDTRGQSYQVFFSGTLVLSLPSPPFPSGENVFSKRLLAGI